MPPERVRLDEDASERLEQHTERMGASRKAVASEAIRQFDQHAELAEKIENLKRSLTPALNEQEQDLIQGLADEEGYAKAWEAYQHIAQKREEMAVQMVRFASDEVVREETNITDLIDEEELRGES